MTSPENEQFEVVAPRDSASPADMVQPPAKVMRIGTMIKQLLEEVRTAP